jgi:hypothetical protein
MLSVLDATYPLNHPGVNALTASVASQILDLEDGHAARDVLSHSPCTSSLNDNQNQRLASMTWPGVTGHQQSPLDTQTSEISANRALS